MWAAKRSTASHVTAKIGETVAATATEYYADGLGTLSTTNITIPAKSTPKQVGNEDAVAEVNTTLYIIRACGINALGPSPMHGGTLGEGTLD